MYIKTNHNPPPPHRQFCTLWVSLFQYIKQETGASLKLHHRANGNGIGNRYCWNHESFQPYPILAFMSVTIFTSTVLSPWKLYKVRKWRKTNRSNPQVRCRTIISLIDKNEISRTWHLSHNHLPNFMSALLIWESCLFQFQESVYMGNLICIN